MVLTSSVLRAVAKQGHFVASGFLDELVCYGLALVLGTLKNVDLAAGAGIGN